LLGDTCALTLVAKPVQHHPQVGPMAHRVRELLSEIRARVLVDGDMIDLRETDPGFFEAITDRLSGKAGPMLDAQEPFFFGRGHHRAVAKQARRCVSVKGIEAQDNCHDGPRLPGCT
jgi:hypothetical protein